MSKNIPALKSIQTKLSTTYAEARAVRGILEGRFSTKRFPSVKAWISQCYHMPSLQERRMCAINEVLHGCGVEAIWSEKRSCVEPFAVYVNFGDTYENTIVRYHTGTYRITSWGDVVEANRL